MKGVIARVAWVAWSAGALSACAETEPSVVDRGRELFESSSALSPSNLNAYSCATCHDEAPGLGVKKTGAPLAGATLRPLFWGGQENDLLESINACRNYFMLAPDPLPADDEKAEALYAYLESLEPGSSAPVPFDVVTIIEDVPRGNSGRGAGFYSLGCSNCHGATHTGAGRLSTRVTILPEEFLTEHAEYTPRVQRLIMIEKIRHGRFLGYGGEMPPFSSQLMSDAEMSDVLEFLGILGQ